jgi:hypothetical protein
MPRFLLGHTLDLDSTVFCRYRIQEGSQSGDNPQKRGRPSHHPLIAFLSEARRLLWATAPGGAGWHDECQCRVAHPGPHASSPRTSHGLGGGRCGLLSHSLADLSGTPGSALHHHGPSDPVLRRVGLHRLPETAWRRISKGIDVAE